MRHSNNVRKITPYQVEKFLCKQSCSVRPRMFYPTHYISLANPSSFHDPFQHLGRREDPYRCLSYPNPYSDPPPALAPRVAVAPTSCYGIHQQLDSDPLYCPQEPDSATAKPIFQKNKKQQKHFFFNYSLISKPKKQKSKRERERERERDYRSGIDRSRTD